MLNKLNFFAEFKRVLQNVWQILNKQIEIAELCKGVHCVDLGESFQTHTYLQNLASTQPRTSSVKFAAVEPCTASAAAPTPPLHTPHPAAGDGDDAEVVLALLLQRGALADVDARNLSRPRNTNFEEVPIRK